MAFQRENEKTPKIEKRVAKVIRNNNFIVLV